MRKIAIVGSGITGLVAAHGLLRQGCDVTVYSDRTAGAWLNESRPTGTAARFDLALSYERELGLNHWDDAAPKGEGVFLTFCPTLHNPLLHLIGRLRAPFQAVDVRLQSARWMEDLATRGGRVVIGEVTVDALDGIAAEHDLTIVAAGRGPLCNLFARDETRSTYREPQRELAMAIVTGCPASFDGIPFRPVRFDFLGTDGEVFFVPYFHKDAGAGWNILVEAKSGSRMDRFRNARSGAEVVELVRSIVTELFPWDAGFVRDMQLADANGWLVGRVAPVVRRASATLPSGRAVAALGDTAISYDPIAAQGANSGVKQARHLVDAIVRRGDAPFTAAWVDATFDAYYAEHAQHAVTFSNLLLEPLTAPAKELLIAQYGSDGRAENPSAQQRIADAFIENFNDPRLLTPAFTDMAVARAVIARHNQGRWFWNGVRGRASIAGNQVRMRLGAGGGKRRKALSS
jgi:2-polyprenyl-6-methoxyphenol hydroxylase-like FAD-dependent oxidoreductase